MMTAQEAWYIGQRAEALAIMYLTRREDLIVLKQKPNYGLDFLVTIKKAEGYSGRLFGVEVKSTNSTPTLINNNLVTIKLKLKSRNFMTEFPFPVCLFVFTLDKDQSYYKWILKPVVEEDNHSTLKLNKSDEFQILNNEEIDNIILAVNRWYDSRSSLSSLS